MVSDEHASDVERRLQDLVEHAREGLDTELKGWLDLSDPEHKADLAKAILALANHGGGHVLVGFAESRGGWVAAEPRPPDLSQYSQDDINGIVHSYAEPVFHCEVHFVAHPDTGDVHPVITVPGERRVPIRAKRDGPNRRHVLVNSYYIRRPGPRSECPQTGQEWDDLMRRCLLAAREELVDSFRGILYGPAVLQTRTARKAEEVPRLETWIEACASRWERLVEEAPQGSAARFSNGTWRVAYGVMGDFERPGLRDLKELLARVQGHETGWPPWWVPTREDIAPYTMDGVVECWLGVDPSEEPAHSDFWRASTDGLMYLARGYQEDGVPNKMPPGTIFDLILPIWRVGECLLHAERLCDALGGAPLSVDFRVMWSGLAGRRLTAWAGRERYFFDGGQARQDGVTSRIVVAGDQISVGLPEIVASVVMPLYEVFDFFQPSPEMIRAELARMRGHRE